MPVLALVIFIATRLHLEGEVAASSMLDLFTRAGIQLAARDLIGSDLPS